MSDCWRQATPSPLDPSRIGQGPDGASAVGPIGLDRHGGLDLVLAEVAPSRSGIATRGDDRVGARRARGDVRRFRGIATGQRERRIGRSCDHCAESGHAEHGGDRDCERSAPAAVVAVRAQASSPSMSKARLAPTRCRGRSSRVARLASASGSMAASCDPACVIGPTSPTPSDGRLVSPVPPTTWSPRAASSTHRMNRSGSTTAARSLLIPRWTRAVVAEQRDVDRGPRQRTERLELLDLRPGHEHRERRARDVRGGDVDTLEHRPEHRHRRRRAEARDHSRDVVDVGKCGFGRHRPEQCPRTSTRRSAAVGVAQWAAPCEWERTGCRTGSPTRPPRTLTGMFILHLRTR